MAKTMRRIAKSGRRRRGWEVTSGGSETVRSVSRQTPKPETVVRAPAQLAGTHRPPCRVVPSLQLRQSLPEGPEHDAQDASQVRQAFEE